MLRMVYASSPCCLQSMPRRLMHAAGLGPLREAFSHLMLLRRCQSADELTLLQLESYYSLSYTVVSLIFLSPLVGYVASALLNNTIHLHLGQRGVAFISPGCHVIAYLATSLHPPYPVLVAIFMVAGMGNGLEDAAWNAWLGNMANPNELLGFLHAFYGLGATLSPLVATSMVARAGLPWYRFYYVMVRQRTPSALA